MGIAPGYAVSRNGLYFFVEVLPVNVLGSFEWFREEAACTGASTEDRVVTRSVCSSDGS